MAYNNKKTWYRLKNPDKFQKPHDEYMKSFNESTGEVLSKSSLELKTIQYCDLNPNVLKFSLEPFAIKYIKPTDNKVHRYYPDVLIAFKNKTFLVEIKSSAETKPPKPPKKITSKSSKNYSKAVMTYKINSAKWKAASKFCKEKGIEFIFITEKELGL